MYYDNPRINKKLNKKAKLMLINKLGFDEGHFDFDNNIIIGDEYDQNKPIFVQPSYDYLSGEVMYALSDIVYDAEIEHTIEIIKHRIMNPHDVFKYAEMYL